MVSNYLLQKCIERLTPLFGNDIHLAFYQDDFLLGVPATHHTQLTEATHLVMSILKSYSFSCREAKCSIALPMISFCGYELSQGQTRPSPSRNIFTHELRARLWKEFARSIGKDGSAILKWLRSICGMFQYLYGYLGAMEMKSLAELYDLMHTSGTPSDLPDLSSFEPHFNLLMDSAINGLPYFVLGHCRDCIATVIIVDANQQSWSSMMFKIIRSTLLKFLLVNQQKN